MQGGGAKVSKQRLTPEASWEGGLGHRGSALGGNLGAVANGPTVGVGGQVQGESSCPIGPDSLAHFHVSPEPLLGCRQLDQLAIRSALQDAP